MLSCMSAMLGPYDMLHFVMWCQVNALLTGLKKDSQLGQVITNLSWPHPMDISVKGCMPRDVYMDHHKKMPLSMAGYIMVRLIQQAGKGWASTFTAAHAYWQLPLDPCDLLLVCLKAPGCFIINVSLLLDLRW